MFVEKEENKQNGGNPKNTLTSPLNLIDPSININSSQKNSLLKNSLLKNSLPKNSLPKNSSEASVIKDYFDDLRDQFNERNEKNPGTK
jgi:hypothetical protein